MQLWVFKRSVKKQLNSVTQFSVLEPLFLSTHFRRKCARLLQWPVFLSDDNITLNGPLLQSSPHSYGHCGPALNIRKFRPKHCAISEFLTLNPNYMAFYRRGRKDLKKALQFVSAPMYIFNSAFFVGALLKIKRDYYNGFSLKKFQSTRSEEVLQIFYKILESSNVPFGTARYIRIFDVISEIKCVLQRWMCRFEDSALYPNFGLMTSKLTHSVKVT